MRLVGLIVAFVLGSALFGGLEWAWPANPSQPAFFRRRGFGTDLLYWFFTPLVTRALTFAAVVIVFVLFALKMGVHADKAALQAFASRETPFSRQARWLQAFEVLFFGDFLAYWQHRAFHGRALWKFHAVHHGSKDLDWLSSVRLHPLNDVLGRLFQVVPAIALGFNARVLAAYMPFLTLWAITVHANVPWTLGPLRFVFASPVFHRWHHTSEAEGLDKNFAGLFPVWDLLFGTFYMPKERLPQSFGDIEDRVPEGFLAQMIYPLRRAKPAAGAH